MSTADDAVKAAPPGLKRLLKRKLPTIVYHLRAVEPEVLAAAEDALSEAKAELDLARLYRDDQADEAVSEATAKVESAQAALAACFEPITLRALPPGEYEALVAAHKDEKAEDGVDSAGLRRAAFLACVQGDLSEAEWDEVFAQCSMGERVALFATALAVNIRNTDGSIPKG